MMNIARHNDYYTSNFALRGATVKLLAKKLVGAVPDGDGWEEVWDDSVTEERYRAKVRLNPGRKQRAAKCARPEVIIVKDVVRHPAPVSVAMAILNDASPEDLEIVRLEAEIKRLMGLD